jgi:hypothetical protein
MGKLPLQRMASNHLWVSSLFCQSFSTPCYRQCMYKRNTEARLHNHCCRGKIKTIVLHIPSVYLSSCLSYPACKAYVPYYIVTYGLSESTIFFHIAHKQHDLQKKFTEHKMCVLIFSITFVWNVSHSKRIYRDIITNLHRSSCTALVFLSDFNKTWICSTDFPKILRNQT